MGGRTTLARLQEQREATRRVQEFERQEVTKYYNDQRSLDTVSNNMLKDDSRRKEREARERQAEQQLLESLYRSEKSRELATNQAAEEERLATALIQQLQASERQNKAVAKLHAESDELKELTEKIRIARMNKERALQLKEREMIKQQDDDYNRAFDEQMDKESAAAAARELQHAHMRKEMNVASRMVLEEQMAARGELQRQAEAEFARERAMVDELVRRIDDEDRLELEAKRSKQEDTKEFIRAFLEDQDRQRAAKRESEAQQEKQIAEYWEMVREREAGEAAKAAQRKEAADRIYERLKREKEAEMAHREEEEYLINLLRQEEMEARKRAEDDERKRRQDALRDEVRRANEQQLRLRAEREAALRAEEEDFRARMMARFAEDDRIEQMNAQKRRMKVMEHKREVERLIAEKRAMYEALKAQEEAEEAARRAAEERRQAMVEEERLKLLREAAELREYLPKGVLRNAKELDYVNQLAQATGNMSLRR